MEYALSATKTEARAGSYYDRIARLYDLTFKVNGYGRSLDTYFAIHPLPVDHRARSVFDFGGGCAQVALLQSQQKTRRHFCARQSVVAAVCRRFARPGGDFRRVGICEPG